MGVSCLLADSKRNTESFRWNEHMNNAMQDLAL
jgi:hypothetical protein